MTESVASSATSVELLHIEPRRDLRPRPAPAARAPERADSARGGLSPSRRSPAVRPLAASCASWRDPTLRDLFKGTTAVLDEVAAKSFPRWVLTFSGGKDSTLTSLLAVDYLLTHKVRPRIDIVYADTLQEIPAMRESAGRTLWYLRRLRKATGLDIRVHVVMPEVDQRFWVRMIGKGYPPPGPIFRWCTERLKINPSKPFVFTGERTAVLTGVRFGESANRTGRLNASCAGGECGQSLWMQQGGRHGEVSYFAPIIRWPTCKVWDFLHFVAPEAGWPTTGVYTLYGDTSLRFGCWNCSVVDRDRTTDALIERTQDPALVRLRDMRTYMIKESKKREHRLMRNGHVGPLSLEFRQELLSEVLKARKDSGLEIITASELRAIRRIWKTDAAAIAALPRAR